MYRDYEGVGGDVVDCSFRIHMQLGPGLLESAYEALLAYELGRRGHVVERERRLPLDYDGKRFGQGYRIDMLVDGCIVVELKSVEKVAPAHPKQVLTYLRLLNLPLGYVVNFGEALLVNGVRRIINPRATDFGRLRLKK